jgi:hypothetical protein
MRFKRRMSSGMWRCIDPGLTDVSEERIASIFRVEKFASGEPASAGGCSRWILESQFCVMVRACLPDYTALRTALRA